MECSDIVGYVDPLNVSPGAKAAVKVSCSRDTFTSKVFRLGSGYSHPDAPPVSHKVVDAFPQQTHRGTPQFSRIGSSVRIDSWNEPDLDEVDILYISFSCQPTLPSGSGHEQYLFSSFDDINLIGFQGLLAEDGSLLVRVAGPTELQEVRFSLEFVRHQWYKLMFSIEFDPPNVRLQSWAKGRDIGELVQPAQEEHRLNHEPRISSALPMAIASDSRPDKPLTKSEKSVSFNGKIERFLIETQLDGTVSTILALDFSHGIPTDEIRDVDGKLCGKTINGPSRAVTSGHWNGSKSDWTTYKEGYRAIHFHDDDLDDVNWETSFELDMPKDLRSGCYAVFVDDGQTTDWIPFFVKPDPRAVKVPPVALIIPTFTYTAYANEHLFDENRDVHFMAEGTEIDKYSKTMMKRPDLGISLYDSHNDGSGTCYSSVKRPILNMRPDYCMWLFDGPREFPADLWFVDFLQRELGPEGFDVITDHQISESGSQLLARYQVLMSCSHPEYPTFSMLDTYTNFLKDGGRFMYLGGNGYYWVTTHDPDRPHRIEVRRGEAGCRTFGLPPGNWHHSMTGELGGLWRSRGRLPNKLFGVGSCAMGVGKGSGYGITKEAREHPRVSRFLLGLEADEIIGDFGLVQGAASGDEIDRLDFDLGTPHNAVMVATTKLAGGHSDEYMLFNEETLYPMINTTGRTSDKVRSDIVFFETPSGGAVFSVGSINWVGALAWKAFNNNVAKLTANVLHDFVRDPGMISEGVQQYRPSAHKTTE
ncbi:MAG: hypothetical protein Q9183_003477 [Haloplaca sp. 2 TL-2023]